MSDDTNNTPEVEPALHEMEIDVTQVLMETDALLNFMRDPGSLPGMDLSVHVTPVQEAEAKDVFALPITRWEAYALAATLWRAQEITRRRQALGKLCTCPRCKMMFALESILEARITNIVPRPLQLPANKEDIDGASNEAAGMKAAGGLN
jgi:hypothetical protein